jgi:uncharacterized membrane protein YraQ (UPF0718 family)
MKMVMRRYAAVFLTSMLFVVFLAFYPQFQLKAFDMLAFQTETMLLVIPPIFILLGLLDVWVPRESMMRLMGPGSGSKGALLSFLLGSFAAGPLYGAFPVAGVLMKKGASFTNIMVFIGAWSTTKIPMILFESSALGARFAYSRLAIDIVGIVFIAGAMGATISKDEIEKCYERARTTL